VIKQSHDWLGDKSFLSVDVSSNALIAHVSAQAFRMIQSLVKHLDKPAQQVLIQARIINANETFAKELGVAFSAMQKENGMTSVEGGFGHFNVGVARLPLDTQLDVMISAAQKNHLTRVLAMPKIVTANEQEAHIKQGKELAFEETSASGATSVKFKEAVLELRVTPHISPQGEIILDLTVKHDVPGKLADNGQPTIDTQSIRTQVRMKDGETIVLGGIFSHTSAKQESKVPFLSRIPVLGFLFKEQRDRDDREELLVFVTPHLI
jgi:type IV pilus assembly protein PilQ